MGISAPPLQENVRQTSQSTKTKDHQNQFKTVMNGDAGVIRNFAFGSNMSRTKITKRLGLDNSIKHGQRAVLKDHKLSMDLAFSPPTEPAFASVLPSKGDSIYGVVYTLDKEHYTRLYRSEGGPHGGYGEETVYPQILNEMGEPTEHVQAIAFKTKRFWRIPLEQAKKPSYRYRKMLIEGAQESRLPEHYIQQLKRLQVARPVGFFLHLLSQLQFIAFFALAKVKLPGLFFVLGASRPLPCFFYGLAELSKEIKPGLASTLLYYLSILGLVLVTVPLSLVGLCVAFLRGNLVKVIKSVEVTTLIDDHEGKRENTKT